MQLNTFFYTFALAIFMGLTLAAPVPNEEGGKTLGS